MNKREIGLKYEIRAIDILKNLGYDIIEHTSVCKEVAPYDIIARKDSKLFFIEVKGRSGSVKDFQINNLQATAYSYMDDIFIFLINDKDYRFFNIIDSNKKSILNGFNINLTMSLTEFIRLRNKHKDGLEEKGMSGFRKKVYNLGEKLILIFTKTEAELEGFSEGDVLDLSDMVVEKRRAKTSSRRIKRQ